MKSPLRSYAFGVAASVAVVGLSACASETLLVWSGYGSVSSDPDVDLYSGGLSAGFDFELDTFSWRNFGIVFLPVTFLFDIVTLPVQIVGGFHPYGSRLRPD